MTKRLLILLFSVIILVIPTYGQLSKNITVNTPGTLENQLGADKTKVTDLVLVGTINDADFETIKNMLGIKNLDMKNVNIEKGAIPLNAFNRKIMNKLILPISLKSIGARAFYQGTFEELDFTNCQNLEEISGEAFSYINLRKDNVLDFSKCLMLNRLSDYYGIGPFGNFGGHVVLPRNMVTLPKLSFNSFLGSVDLPPVLETIGELAFSKAQLTKSITLPTSLKIIGVRAFYNGTFEELNFTNCINLGEINGESFAYMKLRKDNVLDFSKCLMLNRLSDYYGIGPFGNFGGHVVLPRNMVTLPKLSFNSFLGSVDLPPVLETIGESAFSKAQLTKNIILPTSLKIIGVRAFYNGTFEELNFTNCINLEEINGESFAYMKLTKNNSLNFSKCLILNRLLDYYGVGPFGNFGGHVVLPRNMVTLPKASFALFQGSVDLPPVLEEIEASAFSKAQLTASFILPISLKKIGLNAFNSGTFLELDFSNCQNLEEINYEVFAYSNLMASNILDFSKCHNLTRLLPLVNRSPFGHFAGHVILPRNMTVIPTQCFLDFRGSVDLPPVLEVIEASAFSKAQLTASFVLPASLKKIGANAFNSGTFFELDFSNCLDLEEINYEVFAYSNLIASNILDFSKCHNLIRLLPYFNRSPFGHFSGHVILPRNMTVIPKQCFEDFRGSVDLPPVLEIIGESAFSKAQLTRGLILPNSLEVIDKNAFYNSTIPSLKFEAMESSLSCF